MFGRRADGSLFFDTVFNSDGFNQGVQNIGNSVLNLKSTFLKLGASIGLAFSTKELIEASAGVNALNSQFEQTFGNLKSYAENAMQTVAKESGIVETRLQSVGTSIYAFAKTSGMDSASALNMMQEALRVTADSAAYYDRSLEETAESLKSFLKGNYANDAALGISCTETTRNTAANKLYGKSFQELSEAQKQLTLLQMVKDANQLSGAMGQASREADGWENVTGNLKEAWKQFLAVVGQPVLQVATQIVKNLSSALQTLTEYAKQTTNALSKVFGWDLGNDNSTTAISNVADSTEALTENLNEADKSAKKLQKNLAGFDKLDVLNKNNDESSNNTATSETTMSPTISPTVNTEPVETSVNILTEIFEKLKKKLQPVIDAVKRLKEALDPLKKFTFKALEDFYKDFLQPVGDWALGKGLPRFIDIITDLVKSIDWDKLNKSLDDFWKALEPFAENIGNGLLWFLENVLSPLAKWTINDVIPTFLDLLSGCLEFLNSVLETLKPAAKWLFDEFLSPIAEWTGGVIVSVLDGIAKGLKAIADTKEAVIFLESLAVAFGAFKLTTFVIGIYSAIKAVGLLGIATKAAAVAQGIFNTVMNLNPIGLVVAAIAGLIAMFVLLWNNCDWFREFWINAWNDITEWVGNAWTNICEFFSNAKKTITETFINIGVWFAGVFNKAWEGIKNAFSGVGKFFQNIWNNIKGAFSHVTDWFKDTFSKAWQKVKDVFSAGGKIFNGIKEGITNVFKTVVNGLIGGINNVIAVPFNAINAALSGIKSIEIVGLKPFDWIEPFAVPQIPKLATGTVVPASYGEFMAILGDNKREPEIVSPVSAMKQAFKEAIAEMNFTQASNGETVIVLELDGEVVFKKNVQLNQKYKKRHGGRSAFA